MATWFTYDVREDCVTLDIVKPLGYIHLIWVNLIQRWPIGFCCVTLHNYMTVSYIVMSTFHLVFRINYCMNYIGCTYTRWWCAPAPSTTTTISVLTGHCSRSWQMVTSVAGVSGRPSKCCPSRHSITNIGRIATEDCCKQHTTLTTLYLYMLACIIIAIQ